MMTNAATATGLTVTGLSPNTAGQPVSNLLFVDENILMRDCFSLSLNALDGAITVHAEPSLDAALRLAEKGARVDVVLCSIGSGRSIEPAVAASIQDAVGGFAPAPLIVMAETDDAGVILECLRLGVRGYIVASLGLGVALEAIRFVVAGGTFIPATALHTLVNPSVPRPLPESAVGSALGGLGGLTPRERAVLNCLREGKSNKIIAYQLSMCENTVKAHVRNVLKKLGATNRTEAAYLAHTQLAALRGDGSVDRMIADVEDGVSSLTSA